MYNMPLPVQQFLFITYDVQRKKEKKENFTYTKGNPHDEVIFKRKSFMINYPQKAINSHLSFFMTFKHLSHFLILSMLNSLHINHLEESCAQLSEILN